MGSLSISSIQHFVEIHAIIVYFIIFIGVIAEGDITVILAGIFSHLGSINIFIALIAVVLGGATKSFFGYTIGSYLNRRHSNNSFIHKIERSISCFYPNFKNRPFWSIFASRFFLFGIGWFTLIFSGFNRVPLKTYIKAEAFSLSCWSVGLLFVGYSFSYTALSISRDVRNFLALILVFFIMFFVLEKIIGFVIELFELQD